MKNLGADGCRWSMIAWDPTWIQDGAWALQVSVILPTRPDDQRATKVHGGMGVALRCAFTPRKDGEELPLPARLLHARLRAPQPAS